MFVQHTTASIGETLVWERSAEGGTCASLIDHHIDELNFQVEGTEVNLTLVSQMPKAKA